MICKVMGIQHAEGEYQGRKYDNINLHVTFEKNGVTGAACDKLKFKTTFISQIAQSNGITTADFLGKTVNVGYNQYGQPETLTLMEKVGK